MAHQAAEQVHRALATNTGELENGNSAETQTPRRSEVSHLALPAPAMAASPQLMSPELHLSLMNHPHGSPDSKKRAASPADGAKAAKKAKPSGKVSTRAGDTSEDDGDVVPSMHLPKLNFGALKARKGVADAKADVVDDAGSDADFADGTEDLPALDVSRYG